MNLAPMMSSTRGDWQTPPEVVDRVRAFCAGRGLLDPCAANDRDEQFADCNFTKSDDGLSPSWRAQLGWSVVAYVNPPYGRGIGAWIDKCLDEYMRGAEVVALVPARTDTGWFATCWKTATAMCFWRGRMTFVGAPSPAPFPSALVYWGQSVRRFLLTFEDAGKVVTL